MHSGMTELVSSLDACNVISVPIFWPCLFPSPYPCFIVSKGKRQFYHGVFSGHKYKVLIPVLDGLCLPL